MSQTLVKPSASTTPRNADTGIKKRFQRDAHVSATCFQSYASEKGSGSVKLSDGIFQVGSIRAVSRSLVYAV